MDGNTTHDITVLLSTIIFLFVLSGVMSFRVEIYPKEFQALKLSNVTVRCTTVPVQPITACTFRIWYVSKGEQGVLLNVSASENRTSVMVPNPYHPGTNYTASFMGGAVQFNAGTCTTSLYGLRGQQLLIGCKLTGRTKFSAVETMSVFFYDSHLQALVTEPNSVDLVYPEESVNVTLRTNDGAMLNRCTFQRTNNEKVFISSANKTNNELAFIDGSPASPRYSAIGGTLAQGECGFSISNVTDEDNGVFFVLAHGEGRRVGAKAVTLIVEKGTAPTLAMTFSKDAEEYEDGEVVTVTCTAGGVTQGSTKWIWFWWNATSEYYMPQPQGQTVHGWSWPWQDAVISQSVTLTLTQRHHDLDFMCSVDDITAEYRTIKIKQLTSTAGENPFKASISMTQQTSEIPARSAASSAESSTTSTKASSTASSAESSTTSTTASSTASLAESSTTSTTASSTASLADSSTTPTTNLSTPIVPTVGSTAKSSFGDTGSGFDALYFHLTVVYVILAVLVVLATVGVVFYAKRQQRCCFKVALRKATPEPIYHEIADALEFQSLPPPSLPERYMTHNVIQMAVPDEQAPARPVEPKYANQQAPDGPVNADGYLTPIAIPSSSDSNKEKATNLQITLL